MKNLELNDDFDPKQQYLLGPSVVAYRYLTHLQPSGGGRDISLDAGHFLNDDEVKALIENNILEKDKLMGVKSDWHPRIYGHTYLNTDLKNLIPTLNKLQIEFDGFTTRDEAVGLILNALGFSLNEERMRGIQY